MQKTFVLLFILLLVIAFGCNRSKSGGKKLTVAVIPKGTSHEFWKSIHAGSIKAARELSAPGAEVEVIWKGPLREDDRELQIQVVEGFTSQGVSGMVLAPLDSHALARPVAEAKNAGVPTVIIDWLWSRIQFSVLWLPTIAKAECWEPIVWANCSAGKAR